MWNFEHEIESPQEKAIKKFLWFDYFHDGRIEKTAFKDKSLIITLDSPRDEEIEWEKLKGTDDEKRQYLKENADKYVYHLIFENVYFYNLYCEGDWGITPEYINGKFKITAKLRILEKRCNRKLYHFRIQLSSGFLDIIFKSFKIRKKVGNVDYKIPSDWLSYKPPFMEKSYDIAEDIIKASGEDDAERYVSMMILYNKRFKNLLEIARNNLILSEDWLDSSIRAVSILGKIGTVDDIIKLKNYYDFIYELYKKNSYYAIFKQEILDAIDMIKYNESEKLENNYKV